MTFKEFVDINPKVSLKKGEEYSFIPMEDVSSGNRYSKATRTKIYKGGGTKFRDHDIIFARITPCLENGKIAQAANLKNGLGFGSTEYFVFRGKKEISDTAYIYYLSLTDIIKKTAEKSMSGASGRQRADIESIKSIELDFPDLPTQHKIASILSAYDDLIENNTRRIKILEEMAQAIYKEWFVNFRFPGHEKVKFVDSSLGNLPTGKAGIPERWERKNLNEIANIVMGQSPKSEFYNSEGIGLPFHQGVTDFGFRFPSHNTFCSVENRIAEKYDILFSVRAPVGRINVANTKMIIGRGLSAIHHKNDLQSFLFYYLKNIFTKEDTIGSGAIFNSVTKEDMHNIKIINPNNDIEKKFDELVKPLDLQIENLNSKISNLRKTRDLLLPKLMSGEVKI